MTQSAILLKELERRSGPLIDLGLSRIEALLAQLGHPEQRLPPVIHVAGTNGKGSLIAYLTAIFGAAGLRVHRYISPHLVRFHERILLAGEEIGEAQLVDYLNRVAAPAAALEVTFFEATTAAAFLAFAETPADVLLLETGLGGRLDATNVIAQPILTAITPISYDHQSFLGNTITAIAEEKAGILKPGVPCIVGRQLPEAAAVIRQKAAEQDVPLFAKDESFFCEPTGADFSYRSAHWHLPHVKPSLPGAHQYGNAATAIACAELLADRFGFTPEHVQQGIASARWPGRLQQLDPAAFGFAVPKSAELWLDGGHNPAAGVALAAWAAERSRPLDLIWGMMADKDAAAFLAPLKPYLRSVQTVPIPGAENAASSEELAALSGGTAISGVEEALQNLCGESAASGDILIAGSLYLAGSVLSLRYIAC